MNLRSRVSLLACDGGRRIPPCSLLPRNRHGQPGVHHCESKYIEGERDSSWYRKCRRAAANTQTACVTLQVIRSSALNSDADLTFFDIGPGESVDLLR